MAEGKHLGADLGVGAGADEHEVGDEAHELVGEAEQHGHGSCPITPTIRASEGASALPPPRPEGRHSNRRPGCYGTPRSSQLHCRQSLHRKPSSAAWVVLRIEVHPSEVATAAITAPLARPQADPARQSIRGEAVRSRPGGATPPMGTGRWTRSNGSRVAARLPVWRE